MAKGIHDRRYQMAIDALRTARRDRKISQAMLAQKLGQRQQYVSKYESGERRLDIVEFVDVAKILEIDLAEMLSQLHRTHL